MRTPTTPTETRTATVADDSAQDVARQELHRRGLL